MSEPSEESMSQPEARWFLAALLGWPMITAVLCAFTPQDFWGVDFLIAIICELWLAGIIVAATHLFRGAQAEPSTAPENDSHDVGGVG